ncbi:MAG: L,D-transpeptidase family protein [Acidobacteriota bacterium]
MRKELRYQKWLLPFAFLLTLLLSINSGCFGEGRVVRETSIAGGFKAEQMKFPRVRGAAAEKERLIKDLFANKGLSFPPRRIFIRIFKREQVLEVWAGAGEDNTFQLLKEYKVCANSGVLGPKRREGDLQVPEGFYHIDVFNPMSNFHLSMRVNYPNQSDRILGVKGKLGGDIYIHGNCVTIGCVPITDDGIKELYLIAVEARAAGQQNIPVHIFPAKLKSDTLSQLQREYGDNKILWDFWRNLKSGYDYFEEYHRLPNLSVDKNGKYIISQN